MFRRFSSLRTRIVLLVLLAALPAAALMILNNFQARNQARLAFQENVFRLTSLVKANQLAVFSSTQNMLTTLSNMPGLLTDPGACSQIFSEVKRDLPSYASINLSDAEGKILCSSHQVDSEISIVDRSYFKRVQETHQFSVGDYAVDRLTGVPVMPFAYPVMDADQRLGGVLIANLDLNWQHTRAAETDLPTGAAFLLVDSQGVILTRYPDGESFAGQNFTDAPIIQSIVASQGEGIRQTKGVDGVERLYAFSPLWPDQTNGLYVSIGIPTEVAYAAINNDLIVNLLTLGAISTLATSLAMVLSNRLILAKVDDLVITAKNLEKGNFDARTQLSAGDTELDHLGRAFNNMAAGLGQREIQLRQADARYRSLVEQMPAVTYSLSVDETIRMSYVSPQVYEMLGFSAQEWLLNPENWSRHLFHEDAASANEEITSAIRLGQPYQVEYRMTSKDGSVLWVRDEARPVHNETGEILFYQGIWIDISSQKSLEETLRQYSDRLERSNRELQDFAYIASHDLQEPLRKIQAFGERLDTKYSDRLGEEGKDYLNRMRAGAARLQHLINDLLAYSRVGTKTQPFTRVDLNEVLGEVIEDLEQRISETRGRVELSDLPPVLADRLQMHLLFQNLIGNALKFHREDVPPVVKISCRKSQAATLFGKSTFQIVVEDNGIGFDVKYLDRIFMPFQRLHGRDSYEGSGIGLAICRKIVERHNGVLTAASKIGEGSMFIVSFPAV